MNRDLITIFNDMIEIIDRAKEEVSAEIMKKLNGLNDEAQDEFDSNYRKCDACGEYVPEDYLEEIYDENICEQCRENGYGK